MNTLIINPAFALRIIMNKRELKKFQILITPEQEKILFAKSKAAGFNHTSEYVRFIIFIEMFFIEKLNKIYEKVVKNDR